MKHFFSYKDCLAIIKALLKPNAIYDAIEDVPLDQLYQQGFRCLVLDVDNTLLPYSEKLLNLKKRSWIKRAKVTGFQIFLLSNNSSHKRIERIAKDLETTGIFFSMKPLPFSLKQLLKDHQISPEKTICVGDQLLTDVIQGNWSRVHTVLVNPIDIRSKFFKTFQRDVELGLLRWLR